MKNEKVIMLFHKSFQPFQGHYLRTYNQARALVKTGCEVTVFAWDRECRYEKEETRDGIRILRHWLRARDFQGPKNAPKVLGYNWAALRYLMRADVDIITCYSLDAMIVALLAGRLKRRKVVLDVCEPDYYAFWSRRHAWLLNLIRRLEKSLARRFDHVTVHNLYQVQKFQSAGVRHITQIGSYPNQSMMADAVRVRDNGTVVIGRLGTVYEDNGIEEFVAAFKRLLERQEGRKDAPVYKFMLAGRVLDDYRETLDALVKPLGDHVILSGAFQPTEQAGLYEKIDISLILYRRNADWFRHITPTKLFDSLASGVPVLASDMGEVRQIVEDGDCGVVVDEEDPDSICAGIERLASDRETRRRMSENALELARTKYTWEVYESTFLDIYGRLT